MALSADQLVALARGAGLPADQGILATAAAVALAESGGNPAALGDTHIQTAVWGPSVGLWQIRSLKDPAALAKAPYRDAAKLTDPTFNAAAMATISNLGRDWSAWSMYRNGGYLQFMADAKRAAAVSLYTNTGNIGQQLADASKGTIAGTVASPLIDLGKKAQDVTKNPLDAIADFARALSDPNTWVRVVEVVAGMTALVLGGVLLAREVAPSAVGAVTQVAGMVST